MDPTKFSIPLLTIDLQRAHLNASFAGLKGEQRIFKTIASTNGEKRRRVFCDHIVERGGERGEEAMRLQGFIIVAYGIRSRNKFPWTSSHFPLNEWPPINPRRRRICQVATLAST